jgi:8-oxo-dGTP diphosphatase
VGSALIDWMLFGKESTYTFSGAYGHQTKLILYPRHVKQADHVLIFPVYQQQWLFTRHKLRGLELPGGKVEQGETPLEAAIREMKEETGARVSSIWMVGQYQVREGSGSFFHKNVYAAEVDSLGTCSGADTEGPVLLPLDIQPREEQGFSPLVRDPVFQYVRDAILVLNTPHRT